jgi:hypothetical protein
MGLSGLGWKLRRLRAMGAGEILHRARNALREHLAPPAWELWTPLEAGQHLFATYGGAPLPDLYSARLARPGALDGADARVLDAGRRLLEGRWSLFGHEVRLDDPPDWNRNYRTGAAWPDLSARKVHHRRADIAGGVKWTWELGRLTTLPTMALAARRSDDDALAARCERWLADWNETNPLGHGVHYTSGIEMAVRVLTTQWTLALLGERFAPQTVRATRGLMAQQALYCRDHLSIGSSANNHLISEYAAMTVMGALHTLHGENKVLERGLAGLEREALAQLHEDGVPGEQAFGYLPFIWELLLLPFIAAEVTGHRVDPRVRERLAATLSFARDMRLPNGRLPSIGDEDDARVLLAELDAPRLDLVGGALAAWLGGGAAGLDDSACELALLLTGRRAGAATPPRQGTMRFPHGGYSAWRHGDQLVTFDHGPLGYGTLAAHGHADALAITVHAGEVPLIADPGTFAYQDDLAARDRCRSTPVHATVHFGGRSQSEMLGPFLWGRRARVDGITHEDAARVRATCTWWTGERHTRALRVDPGRIEITDRVQGPVPAISFPLPPRAEVRIEGATAIVELRAFEDRPLPAPLAMRITAEGIGDWTVEDSEHASNFGRFAAATRLAAPLRNTEARTVIEVSR